VSEATAFRARLAETMAWCARRIDVSAPKVSLRSDDLRPHADYDDDGITIWIEPEMIDRLVEARARIAMRRGVTVPDGRLLLCYYEENNHNWASAEASQWFFDGHDNPPWDTWVGRCDNALVAWVPAPFLHLAQAGIETECMGMLDWADSASRMEWRTTPAWLSALALEVRGRTSGCS
jgi:hypothetical protein